MRQPPSHLSRQELDQLRARLEQERERLHMLVRSTGERTQLAQESGDAGEEPTDYADQGLEITTEDTEQALGENDQALLNQVERALARMADGSYGLSEFTGKAIPKERLEVLPWVTTNVDDPVR